MANRAQLSVMAPNLIQGRKVNQYGVSAGMCLLYIAGAST